MHDENVKKLIAKHGIKSPCCWSSLPDGWVVLVDNLMTDLIAIGWDKNLDQVKSKFGGLRFDIRASSDEITNRISKAEEESMVTCEHCGSPGRCGRHLGGYWIATLCNACIQKERESRDQS